MIEAKGYPTQQRQGQGIILTGKWISKALVGCRKRKGKVPGHNEACILGKGLAGTAQGVKKKVPVGSRHGGHYWGCPWKGIALWMVKLLGGSPGPPEG
jgi:hypothetical protein